MNIRNCVRIIERFFFFLIKLWMLTVERIDQRFGILSLRDYASLLVFCLKQRMYQGPMCTLFIHQVISRSSVKGPDPL